MRYKIGLLLLGFCFLAIPASAQGTLSPAVPVANQGATIQFSCTANCGTSPVWTCPGCAGGINSSTGLYTAPATITPQQSIGGFQLHPNNHVYNTRIDSLALRSDSVTLMAGTGTANVSFTEVNDIPVTYTNGSTPLVPMTFLYTPAYNGNFEIPAFPNAKSQSGWLDQIQAGGGGDHHMIMVDTTNGTLYETYGYLPTCTTTAASVDGSNKATLTCSTNPSDNNHGFVVGNTIEVTGFSGADTYFNVASAAVTAVTSTSISYALTHAAASASTNGVADRVLACAGCNATSGIKYNYSDYLLPVGGASTDAAGLELAPLLLRLQEVKQAIATGGTINHALRMTLSNGFICGSSLAGACYAGKPVGIRHIWPATSEAFSGGGLNPYGLRYRLKAAFDISTFSPIAQILLTQMKQYGLILSDGGTNWAIAGEATSWPPEIASAFYEIGTSGIQGSTNFEVVDEDPLKIVSTSGETTNNRETVTYTSSTGIATVDVALMGVAVAVPDNVLYFQDGTPGQQLPSFSNIGSVTWAMTPQVGTLTSGGFYTPPATDASFIQELDAQPNVIRINIQDKNVALTGSYGATERYVNSLNTAPPYEWQMYMLALKSASSPFGASPVQILGGSLQTCSNTCTGGFSVNATNGNMGIVAVYEEDTTATISSTSFACGTMTLDSNSPKRGSASSMWVYTVQLTSGTCGAGSIGITFNHSVSGSISTTEYHNMATSNVVDCSGSGSATSFTLSTSPCSTSNANDTIWAISIVGHNLCGGSCWFIPGGYTTTLTATSTTNAAIKSSITLVTLPSTGIRIRPGVFTPSFSNPVFTDSHGIAWLPTGGDTISGQRFTDLDIGTGGSFPAVTDIAEYYFFKSFRDVHYTFYVPNGKYQITAKCATGGGVGTSFDTFATQGQISLADADINVRAGGSYKPVDFISFATVTNNILDFVDFGSRLGGNNPLNALQIVPLGMTLTPGMKVTPGMTIK